ncbi:phage tail protein [Morganella morganii]|uniref:phage tail-collar fiber domain-containing protein n=1 Tax=Morganella morganii TaxID=582 RepID=UPI003314B204
MSSVITTDFERWKAQEAALGKPVALNEFVFANVPGLDPSKDISRDEKLPPAGQIVHRQAVNKAGLASENAVAYSVTLGTDVGDFVFNWIGLVNKESGTLAMITHAPEQRKIKTVDGVQGNVLTRSFLLEFNGAAKETQITTSAETWQIDFTARLAGMDEIQRLANRDIYGAAAFFGDGFLVTKAAEQYRVTPGTAYIEGLRGTLEEITTFNNLRDTKIYADFTFQGNLVSKWQTFVKVTTAKTLAHYQDAAGFQHYVAVIAEIDKNGNITDKRVKGTPTDRELEKLIKELPEKYQPLGNYQPAGNYVDSDYFRLEMLKKFDKANISDQMGNDRSKVPSLDLFTQKIGVLNSGLAEKFDKTGGDISGQVNIKSKGGRVLTLWPELDDETSAYIEAYLRGVMVWWLGMTGGDTLTLENRVINKKITISPSGFKINGQDIAVVSQLLGVGQKYRNVTSQRLNAATYTNTTGKPIVVYIEANRTESSIDDPYSFGGEVDGERVAYRWTQTNEQHSFSFIVPPGSEYLVKAGWGKPHGWSPITKWVELS